MNEGARVKLLSLMTKDTKKFGLGIDYNLPADQQLELEAMQIDDWVRLIDVSYVAETQSLMRVFRVMPEAITWYEANW